MSNKADAQLRWLGEGHYSLDKGSETLPLAWRSDDDVL